MIFPPPLFFFFLHSPPRLFTAHNLYYAPAWDQSLPWQGTILPLDHWCLLVLFFIFYFFCDNCGREILIFDVYNINIKKCQLSYSTRDSIT